MIYQPRNVQPSGVSIDGLLDNTFTMEIQTNSYVSAYQLLIVDFDNNEIYTGSKTTLANYAYNGDTLEIPVSASTVALSNGTNYKWRVRLYQPTADMLITYGLVQATSTTTTIYLQPNINIKAGMAITINSQTKTISSYNSDTGVAVVSNAFSSAPAVGTQYKIYSDFIETVPDYIVYARRTPAVAISNVPSSLTLKYHTFQGTYTQSDNVPIVYHKFDLYTRNDDGTISLVASSDKVYSANLSYTYDSFRTGNKYLIQMTVENDMGIISTTDMYEFNVSYDIVEYLQQPLASFDDKNNAVKVSWVTPVENEATSFRSDAATGIIQDNNNTLTQATFEPGQSIGEGDVVQITNSDCELVIDGKSTQATITGKNYLSGFFSKGTGYISYYFDTIGLSNTMTYSFTPNFSVKGLTLYVRTLSNTGVYNKATFNTTANQKTSITFTLTNEEITTLQSTSSLIQMYKPNSFVDSDDISEAQLESGSTATDYEPYTGGQPRPSPDYPSEIESVGYENLFDKDNTTYKNGYYKGDNGEEISTNYSGYITSYVSVQPNTIYTISGKLKGITNTGAVYFYDNLKNWISRLSNASLNEGEFTFTTPNNCYYMQFQYIMSVYDASTIQITKGTKIYNYIPYGKYGIEVKTVGKNLFDGIYQNAIVGGDGVYNISNSTRTAIIKIKPNTNYSIKKFTNTGIGTRFIIVESSTLLAPGQAGTVKYNSNSGIQYSYTSGANANYLYVYVTNDTSNIPYLMVVESNIIPTTYEPYKSVSSLFQLDQPLRSLPNGVKDELVIENGRAKIIKRIGTVVLDGSENWNNIQEATTSTDYYYAYTIVYDKLIGSKYTGISNNFIVKQGTYITASSTVDSDMLGVGGTGNGKIRMFIKKSRLTEMTTTELKTWLSTHNTQVDYELAEPQIIEPGDGVVPYIDGINYMHISSNIDTTFSLVYPHKTISGNAYDYTEFNPPGVKQTGTIKSYNAITGIGTLMPQYPFMYTPMQGDSYAVISNIYNVSGFSYLYNTPYNTVNSLYTHGYTATWETPDGLCVLPDDFNITLQFSPDGNFFYDQNGVYQEVVNLITTETDDANNEGEFTIKIDKNKLIFVQNPDISLELPFYTNTTQVFVLSSASVAQINNDYVWDDTATWTDTYTWVEGGTSLERVCNHWWKVQITNTGIKIEEIFPTT